VLSEKILASEYLSAEYREKSLVQCKMKMDSGELE
jgi:hypothetical protein